MFRNQAAMCMVLTAGLLLGSGCGLESGGREAIEVSEASDSSGAEALEDRWGKGSQDEGGGNDGAAAPDDAGGQKEQARTEGDEGKEAENGDGKGNGADEPSVQGDEKAEAMRKRFGENCIGEQTFEAELSEYDGKVWFVPMGPGQGNSDVHIQLIQDGAVIGELNPYVPERLQGETFTSLDAVSFYDINFDGNTDILLIETYGNTTFAAVYYGFDRDGEDYERYFTLQEQLSKRIWEQAGEMSVGGIRKALGDSRKNGKFTSYQEAYEAVGRLLDMSNEDGAFEMTVTYDLIDVDGDEVPELAAGVNGYYVSLYTYSDGKVYTLLDRWSYGVMGNAGYEYAPKKNSLRNYNSDYAGAILYTTYMEVKKDHRVETVAQIKTVNFDDVNGNGVPDEDETESMGNYGVTYLNGKEASPEECAAYDAGKYEMICGDLSLEELVKELKVR